MIPIHPHLLFAAEKATDPVLEKLDPPRRAAVIMALLGLTLVGLFLIVCAMLGGHWVRRLARQRPARGFKLNPISAGGQSAPDSLRAIVPEAMSDDTIQLGTSSKETRIEG
jgi:hypothetical protein